MEIKQFEFDSMEDLFKGLIDVLNKEFPEKKEQEFKVDYQDDLITRLKEQNRKYFNENIALLHEVKNLREALKKTAETNNNLVEENKSLKGGPYNKDFYVSVMSNLGRKIVDEYVLWLNLCKALKLEDVEMYNEINDDMYDKIPEE